MGVAPKPPKKTAICHPDRPHAANGLCKQCYDLTPDRQTYNTQYRKDFLRRDLLKHRYGITIEQYDALLTAQGGVCAICKNPPRGKMLRLSVDHNHTTKKVRGLLCITCNRTIGYLENPEWMRSAQSYLTSHTISCHTPAHAISH